jgi:hypothetical protein
MTSIFDYIHHFFTLMIPVLLLRVSTKVFGLDVWFGKTLKERFGFDSSRIYSVHKELISVGVSILLRVSSAILTSIGNYRNRPRT